MKQFGVIIGAFFVFTFLGYQTVQAYDFQTCDDCHEATLYGDNSRIFLHSPYAQQQCGECHAAETTISAQAAAPIKDSSISLQDRNKINWLGDSTMLDTIHAFLLPADKVADTLVVDLQDTAGRFSRHEIAVPPLASLAEVEDSGKPPVISEVQVLKVQRGVFLSITIGWRTDTLTKASVRYGNRELSQTSEPSSRFGRLHEAVLYNLKTDQTYRYSVIATDLFGRSQISEILKFSTRNPSVVPLPSTSDNFPAGATEAALESTFQRLGADYLLELTLVQPAAVYIGSRGEPRQQRLAAESTSAMGGEEDEYHAGLSSEIVISMGACASCHESQNTATHPVNVYPKPGMTIPPEYPTLADGRITCNSCHAPHGSDYEFLARKSGKRELCVGCHLDML